MTIYLDFDGTVVEHAYPAMGRFNPHAVEVVEKLQQKGHTVILNTYRSNTNDGTLEKALEYLHEHPTVNLKPMKATKEKLFPPPFMDGAAKLAIYKTIKGEDYFFIDDMQADIPLIPAHATPTDMVDWMKVEKLLMDAGIL